MVLGNVVELAVVVLKFAPMGSPVVTHPLKHMASAVANIPVAPQVKLYVPASAPVNRFQKQYALTPVPADTLYFCVKPAGGVTVGSADPSHMSKNTNTISSVVAPVGTAGALDVADPTELPVFDDDRKTTGPPPPVAIGMGVRTIDRPESLRCIGFTTDAQGAGPVVVARIRSRDIRQLLRLSGCNPFDTDVRGSSDGQSA